MHASTTFSISKVPPRDVLKINTNTQDLCDVAKNTLRYLNLGSNYDKAVIHSDKLAEFGIQHSDVKRTLAYICKITDEDKATHQNRLTDFSFLSKSFDFYRITSDTKHAEKLSKNKPLLKNLSSDKVLMTKYYVHLANGSTTKSNRTPYALYGLPFDETHLTIEQANLKANRLTRYKFGKQAILKGALAEEQLAPPLVYLSREDIESALLQGTVVVNVDNTKRVFNVHRNNNIAYDRAIKPYHQERYWYFKEVDGVLGYGKDANQKITVLPEVTFAGDIFQIGLGPLVFAKFDLSAHSEYRLAVMADTGGAFENNLYQLDYLAGSYPGINAYYEANRHLPDYIDAWFMVLKKEIAHD